MKYKGKVISASSLLTILGVVCFATMIVAAVFVTSSALNFPSTTVTASGIILSDSTTPTAAVVDNDVHYFFNATVATALTGAVITVYVNETGILPAALNSGPTITFNGGSTTALVFVQHGSDSLKATYSAGLVASGSGKLGNILLSYNAAGTYTVAVVMTNPFHFLFHLRL
jgi:urease alpha subunit